MRAGLAIILTLALGALVTNFLLLDNGYVLISFRGYTLEMSVPVLLFLMIITYVLVRLLIHTLRAPRKLGEAAGRYGHRKAMQRMTRGYIELSEGNFARGEKLLTRGARNSEAPLLNYLAAARAAQAQGDRERRDNWLQMAYEQDPKAGAAVLLTQAQLQIEGGETEAALATLNKLLETSPNNVEALRLKAQLSLEQGDWAPLEELLPRLYKKGNVAQPTLDEWFVRAWAELLADTTGKPERQKQLLKKLPRHLRGQPEMIQARVDALAADGQAAEAERVVRKALAKDWDKELVLIYGRLEADANVQLKHAEGWLNKHPDDASLLLTAARLCVRAQLWGKARSYYETSIAIEPLPESWHDFGQLMLKFGEDELASDAFRKGLELSYGVSDAPRLPDSPLSPDADEGSTQ